MKHRLTWVETTPLNFLASKPGVRYAVENDDAPNANPGKWEAFCVETGNTSWGKLHVDYKDNPREAMKICQRHYQRRVK
jgi:hypothetical protein